MQCLVRPINGTRHAYKLRTQKVANMVGNKRWPHPRRLIKLEATPTQPSDPKGSVQQQSVEVPLFDPLTTHTCSTDVSTAGTDLQSKATGEHNEDKSLPVKLALGMLQFYRLGISPLMPKSCRFVPSCSEYSIDAYKKYGVWKGTVLTAWRLLRCNPWGSSGFDPVCWPPKGLEAVYQYEAAPQITVLVGAILFAYVFDAMLGDILYR